ncbi:hypothetical protein LX77_02127 [Gelidibacter algens]|uniref:Signal transducing protein n=1 Tax=Gelidibacter algens TaxID=49280 RepID=A0A1A7R3N8_9FLAO|nr:hypothetical protein [Gelidibacter algens]OBX26074.1 hypothetical protein A9996_05960 [Gelidibacter algens]RAJ22968.1 hypothetical protein LX77_02127 [Gelidibacter algens]
MKNGKFTTVAVFQYSAEAQIIKGRLESDGIDVFLSDNLTIDTDPLVSNAIGGVKLKVLSHQVIEAKQILNSIQDYAIDDDGNSIQCPNCKSTHVELFSTIKDLKSFFWFIFGFLFSTLPFYTKHKYRCEVCATEFDLK